MATQTVKVSPMRLNGNIVSGCSLDISDPLVTRMLPRTIKYEISTVLIAIFFAKINLKKNLVYIINLSITNIINA